MIEAYLKDLLGGDTT